MVLAIRSEARRNHANVGIDTRIHL